MPKNRIKGPFQQRKTNAEGKPVSFWWGSSVQEVMVTHLFLLEETLRGSHGWPASFLRDNKQKHTPFSTSMQDNNRTEPKTLTELNVHSYESSLKFRQHEKETELA